MTQADAHFVEIFNRRKGTPFLFEEAVLLQRHINKALLGMRAELDKFYKNMSDKMGCFVPDNFVQQSIDALERGAGDRVEIVIDLIVDRQRLEKQVGEEDCDAILRSCMVQNSDVVPDAINFKGVQGIVINRDSMSNRVLIRTNSAIPMLLWVKENEISPVPEGRIQGRLIDSSPTTSDGA